MSSHREATAISKDPVADNTDTYAFVSPDRPGFVTLITNYVPLEAPDGGPNFYEFGSDVLYEINIDNTGDGIADITYQFQFQTAIRNENTFLYNTGQIRSIDSPAWNRPQFYTVKRYERSRYGRRPTVVASGLACPPCNVGPRSIPDYPTLAQQAIHGFDGGQVFAGQRHEGFYVDLGAIFDLGDLRPFQNLHLIPTPATDGVDSTAYLNVHTIALQVPINRLTRGGATPTDPLDPRATIGVWGAAYRRQASMRGVKSEGAGPWIQVSRLGNPLVNEVINPMAKKDLWNSLPPSADSQFAQYVRQPELAKLLPVLYPGVFPNLAGLTADRADLVAILLTGLPAGIVPNFQNYTGPTLADMLRLNVAVPPTTNAPSVLGILGGDLAGFPNGRRVFDDVTTIEIRAVAGLTYPLVNPSYTPDGAAGAVSDFNTPPLDQHGYLEEFPYLGTPLDGFDYPSSPMS